MPFWRKRSENRVDFAREQDKVASDRRLAVPRGLEVQSGRDAHRGRNIHSRVADRFRSRDANLKNSAVDLSGVARESAPPASDQSLGRVAWAAGVASGGGVLVNASAS